MWFFDFITENTIAQAFWILAMLVAFIWLLQKDDKNTVKIIIISSFFWVIHFYLMWVYSAMAGSMIWILRLALSLKFKRNKFVFLWVLVAFTICWFMTYENKLSLLPIIGSSISAYWYFFLEKFRLRLLIFVSSVLRLTFSINAGSIWSIINEIITQLILIFVMYKIIREEHSKLYFIEKISSFFRRMIPDVDRYIVIYDYIRISKQLLKLKVKMFFYKINILVKLSKTYKVYWRFKKKELNKISYKFTSK